MNNAELIAELRGHILSVPLTLLHDAADALETAEAKIVKLNTKCADLQSQIYEMETEIEELLSKEGEWIWDGDTGTYHCSECNATSPQEDQDGEYIDCPNYCPNCGAKMKKGEEK